METGVHIETKTGVWLFFDRAKRRREVKQQCLDYLGGPVCCRCGLRHDNIVVYDFHHRNPAVKELGIASAIGRGATFEKLRLELKKCVVMCRNCHTIEHAT